MLHALRVEVGDDVSFEILRSWVSDYEGRSATSEEFEAHAAAVAGVDLTGFFVAWLHGDTLPPFPG